MWMFAVAWGGGGGGGGTIGYGGPPKPPPAPPPVAPLGSQLDAHGFPVPALARVRAGDSRWAAGTGARAVDLSPDGKVLLVGGAGGVASFDAATGRLLARHAAEDSHAVAFLPDGRATWIAGLGSPTLGLAGAPSFRAGDCWGPERWALGATPAGEVVLACRDALWVAPPGGQARSLALPDLGPAGTPVLAVSPDGREALVWTLLGAGAWRVPLHGGAPVALSADLKGAAYAPDGRVALWSGDRVELDGKVMPLPAGAAPTRVAFARTGDGLAVASGDRLHVFGAGRLTCTAELGVGVASLAFGETLWVGTHDGAAPLRVDPATCAVSRSGLPAEPTVVARVGDAVLIGGAGFLTSWDARTGASLGATSLQDVALGALVPMPGAVGVVDAEAARVAATYDLPALQLRSAEPPEAPFRLLAPLNLDGGWSPPSGPVAAASPRGDVAAGLEALTVLVGGRAKVFVLDDQVHLGLTAPYTGGFGGLVGSGFGQDEREVSPSWDPVGVRPDGLWLGALGFGADGLLAMAWVFRVTDAWGEDHVKWWVGVLDPARDALAGFPSPNNLGVDEVALSASGEALAWLGDWGPRVVRLPPRARPEPPPRPPPPPAPLPDLEPLAESAGILGLLGEANGLGWSLGDSMDSEVSGPLHEGDAQRLPLTGLFEPARLQGRYAAMALSADGKLLAAGTEREVALWRVGTPEPVWRYDFAQGGTAALAFAGSELWVLGRDGTALAVGAP